jgi:hypothetical protein
MYHLELTPKSNEKILFGVEENGKIEKKHLAFRTYKKN